MKLNYYQETDSLYIDLAEKPSTESKEISEGVVLDYDSDGNSFVSLFFPLFPNKISFNFNDFP